MQTSHTDDEVLALDPDRPVAADVIVAEAEHFVFRLARRTYTLPAASVELVAPPQTIVPVPTVPPHVRGIAHLRGRILAVIDLAIVLGVEADVGDEETDPRLVVMTGGSHPFAFVADATRGIWTAPRDTIVRGPDDGPIVRGRIESEGRAATALDPMALLHRLLGQHPEGGA
jgi:purine-binding chemotaxis protein CheW